MGNLKFSFAPVAILQNNKKKLFGFIVALIMSIGVSQYFFNIGSIATDEQHKETSASITLSEDEIKKKIEASKNEIIETIESKKSIEKHINDDRLVPQQRSDQLIISHQNSIKTSPPSSNNASVDDLKPVSNTIIPLPVNEKLDFDHYYEFGGEYLLEKNYTEALSNFKEAYKMDKEDIPLLRKFALAYFKSGYENKVQPHLLESQAIYNELIALDSNDVKSKYNRAKVNIELRNYEPALSDLMDFLQNTPEKHKDHIFSAKNYVANVYKRLRKWENAAKYYKEVIDLDPTNPKSHYNYGFVLFKGKEFEIADKVFDKAIELGHDKDEVLKYQANMQKGTN